MKKRYMCPVMQVVLLNHQQQLLAGSGGDRVHGGGDASGSEQLSRMNTWGSDSVQAMAAPLWKTAARLPYACVPSALASHSSIRG